MGVLARCPRRMVCALALALLALLPAGAQARTRQLWIASVPVPWTIVPNGQDGITHMMVDPLRTHVDSTVVYQRFTRGFARRLPNRTGGLVGPLIRARVGDRIVVH